MDHEFAKGTKLVDEDRRAFVVSDATSRIVVVHTVEGRFVESITPAFARRKYQAVKK